MRTEKRCHKCKIVKPASEFYLRSSKRWLRGSCKECDKVDRKIWTKGNPDKVRITNRKSGYKRLGINITLEEYDALSLQQGGRCLICGKSQTKNKLLHVDHNHSTGKVRGLLCGKCNSGLGMFGDSVEVLYTAIEYLKKNK